MAARIAATLAVAFGLLLVVNNTHGSAPVQQMVVQPTPGTSPAVGAPDAPEVVVLPTSGVVDDVMASYVAGACSQAESDGAAAVVIQLDTLGGSEERW